MKSGNGIPARCVYLEEMAADLDDQDWLDMGNVEQVGLSAFRSLRHRAAGCGSAGSSRRVPEPLLREAAGGRREQSRLGPVGVGGRAPAWLRGNRCCTSSLTRLDAALVGISRRGGRLRGVSGENASIRMAQLLREMQFAWPRSEPGGSCVVCLSKGRSLVATALQGLC